MKYKKVTIMLRSIDMLYEYNKQGRSFWDDFTGLLREVSGDIVVESGGKFRFMYYLPSENEEGLMTRTLELLTKLGQDPLIFVITISDMKASDIERLKSENVDEVSSRSWFAEAEKEIVAAEAAAIEEEQQSDPEQSETQEGETQESAEGETEEAESQEGQGQGFTITIEEPSAPKRPFAGLGGLGSVLTKNPSGGGGFSFEAQTGSGSSPDRAAVPAEAEPLSTEAERIANLKGELLKVVRGQRHAVDEVVQTIFECDAFNRYNPDRKGPLASFLFTGPSGVGKTFLAVQCAKLLGRPYTVIDMSEFADYFSNGKFNGEHSQPAIVTSFVQKNPNGILIFDEIEKAHINTIHLFLQILDAGRLRDNPSNSEVSFKDTIIFLTTNAGASLYSDPTVVDLSGVSRRTILDALRTDTLPGSHEPAFPECITTRFANGHVILFNHLEPYALMQIVRDEIAEQLDHFKHSSNVDVTYDPEKLSALVLYSTGGIADARTLRGTAKNVLVKEVLDVVMQMFKMAGKDVDELKEIEISVEPEQCGKDVQALFTGHDVTHVLVFADQYLIDKVGDAMDQFGTQCNTKYEFVSDADEFKRRVRGLVDFVLLDPAAGSRPMDRKPNDIEDIDAEGIDLFEYMKSYYPNMPIFLLDVRGHGDEAFSSLIAKGGRGVVALDPEDPAASGDKIKNLSFSALVNNSTFNLGRSGKMLTYNCSQYNVDNSKVLVAFDNMSITYNPSSGDGNILFGGNERNGVKFSDVIGCKKAKEALVDFCKFVENPRAMIAKGKKIPRGVLLYGPPGTGKTMLAKALANEANAAFIPTTATAFFNKYVGESERNVRDIFQRARKYAPAIIFIDEVDAIGRMRTGESGSVHNEDVLNAFIAEMDGFGTDDSRPVFVLAATNYGISGQARVLDPAFVRRFDRKIYVDLPDTDERNELLLKELARHSVHFGENHEAIVKNLAERSSGLSNADLANMLEIFLRSCEDKEPTPAALMDALDSFRFGDVNEMKASDRKQTACHESGHALVARLLGETPAFLTIVSRGDYGGFMEHSHDDKKSTYSFKDLMDKVCISLAGRVAELEVYGTDLGLNSGASSDLAHARYLVKLAINEFAMGTKLYAKGTNEDFEALMQEQYARTIRLVKDNRAVLEALTDLLDDKKSLNQGELDTFFKEQGV